MWEIKAVHFIEALEFEPLVVFPTGPTTRGGKGNQAGR